MRAVRLFLSWVQEQKEELAAITPGMVGQHLVDLDGSTAKCNQNLAALRGFFDRVVNRHVESGQTELRCPRRFALFPNRNEGGSGRRPVGGGQRVIGASFNGLIHQLKPPTGPDRLGNTGQPPELGIRSGAIDSVLWR